jgi:cell division topological specificity factor
MPNIFEMLFPRQQRSGNVAKDRLTIIVGQDRSAIPPHLMEQLREELMEVISRYIEIDKEHLTVGTESSGGAMMLRADIPIRRVRTRSAEPIA